MLGSDKNKKISRRELLKGALYSLPLLYLPACTRHTYTRPAGELDLGTVKELLYSVVHVRNRAALVYRDINGWRALSTRCTYHGCDLTYQPPVLLCPCCKSRFDLEGRRVADAKAPYDLPWVDVYYRDGHLYAEPAKLREATFRFTTPEIEEAIRRLRQRVKTEGLEDEVKIAQVLQGGGDGEPGRMFIENDPNLIHELDMIK